MNDTPSHISAPHLPTSSQCHGGGPLLARPASSSGRWRLGRQHGQSWFQTPSGLASGRMPRRERGPHERGSSPCRPGLARRASPPRPSSCSRQGLQSLPKRTLSSPPVASREPSARQQPPQGAPASARLMQSRSLLSGPTSRAADAEPHGAGCDSPHSSESWRPSGAAMMWARKRDNFAGGRGSVSSQGASQPRRSCCWPVTACGSPHLAKQTHQ